MNKPIPFHLLVARLALWFCALILPVFSFSQNIFKSYPEIDDSFYYGLEEQPSGIDFTTAFSFSSQLSLVELGVTDPDGNLSSSQGLDFADGRPRFRSSAGNYIRPMVDATNFEIVYERLNADGELLNTFSFDFPIGDIANFGSMDEFPDGDLFVAYYYGNELINPSTLEKRTIAYAKVNPATGAVAWEGSFESVFEEFIAIPYLIEIAPDGSIFMAITEQLPTNFDNFVCKISSTGELLWRKAVSTLERVPIQFAATDDGGVAFIYNQVFDIVQKLDANGNPAGSVLLDPVFQSAAKPTAIVAAPNNQILAAGRATPPSSSGSVMYTAFIDEDLNVISTNVYEDFPSTPQPRRGIRLQSGDYAFVGGLNNGSFLVTVNENGVFDPGSGGGDCSDSPIVNGDFENGLNGWTNFGAGNIINNGVGGSQSLQLCDAPGQDNRLLQGLPISPGDEVELKFVGKKDVTNEFFSGYIKYLTSSFQPIDPIEFVSINQLTLTEFSLSSTAPSNAAYIEIGFVSSANATSCAIIDDACLIIGGGAGPCSISGVVQNIQCQDQGTPDADDDTYTFDLLASGVNTPGSEWVATFMGTQTIGQYGVPKSFGPFDAPSFPLPSSIAIADLDDSSCFTNVSFNPPPPCSTPQVICSGDILLTSQAEVDAWPGCNIVEGDLRIAGNDITDLSPLNTLAKVRGAFSVDDNAVLTSLSGLENLDSVGVLIIAENASLQDIDALNLTQTEVASILLINNDNLEMVSNLNNFTNTNNLEIFLNDNLTSITGFNGLNTVNGNLLIQSNSNLTDLDGFSNLEKITGAFQLVSNDVLPGINGFENLTTIEDNLVISSNAGLLNLNGLTSLTDLQLVAIAGNTSLENLDVFSSIASIGGELNVLNNNALSDCCGLYPMLNGGGVGGGIFISGNPMTCSSETEILDNCMPSGDIDLSITLSQPNGTPSQWSNYNVILTVNNAGPQAATGVVVEFAKPNGVVYTGGNEFDASQGTFNPFGNEKWEVGEIVAGGTATLTVSYFLLASESPIAYAQVIAANETDGDSTPGNGTPPLVNEDDEASTGGGGPPNLTPDLTLSNLDLSSFTVEAGDVLNYDFDISNIGNGAAPGDFVVRAYISDDTSISGDDIQDGIVPTGNYGAGLTVPDVSGASTVPISLPAGNYFLILLVDADGEVAESNEGNNTVLMAFTVTEDGGGPPTGPSCSFTTYYSPTDPDNTSLGLGPELTLIESADGYIVEQNREYEGASFPLSTLDAYELDLNGNVLSDSREPVVSEYEVNIETDADNNVNMVFVQSPDLPAGTAVPIDIDYADPTDVIVGSAVKTSNGFAFGIGIVDTDASPIIINRVIQTDDLGQNVTYSDLPEPNFFSGFSRVIEGPDGSLFTEWRTSGDYTLFAVPADGSTPWQVKVAADTPSTTWLETDFSPDGNFVYTMKTDNLQVFISKYAVSTGTPEGIDLSELKTSPIPSGFRQTFSRGIEPTSDGGLLVSISANEFVGSGPDFFGVLAKYDAANNLVWKLEIPEPDFSLTPVGETSDGGALFAGNNGSGEQTVFLKTTANGLLNPECNGGGSGGGDIDLSLSMGTSNLSPGIYSSAEVTVEITNAGPQTATGVVVEFPRPDGTVYTGGNEFDVSQGTFNPFGNEKWEVGNLTAGQTASITVSYFLLTGNALTPYAQVDAANETDGDSSPANGICCTPSEDDETTLTLNAFAGGGGIAFQGREIKGRPIQLVAINPNPVYHGQITVVIDSREEGVFDLEGYDLFGRRAFLQKVDLREGRNDIGLDVSDLRSGTYLLNMPGQNWRNMPIRFTVARY